MSAARPPEGTHTAAEGEGASTGSSITALPLDVVTIGESMALLVADSTAALAEEQHFSKRLAGAETNVAIGLARLGLRVGWISRLGADSFGSFVQRTVAGEGVDCSRVVIDPTRSTGFMLKARSRSGEDPQVEYYRKGSAASAMQVAQLDETYLLSARHLHMTGIFAALSPATLGYCEHSMQLARSAGRGLSFDPNLRPSLWASQQHMRASINRLARSARWVLPGIAEGRLLTGLASPEEIAAYYLHQGAEAVVLKLGADGAYFRTLDGQAGYSAGCPVPQVVDTVGAGDGFAAGLISARLEGLAWPLALQRANWVGAQAIQVLGDMEGLPYRHQLPGCYTYVNQ
ncbi:sugar kinase [Verminephrobacter eiseniae]|nr:sugar kinase [Verminephrobacter eiseniae]MCW5293139.1 sugar kinase [Verminephrobacter eiseniae]MCW8185217.1 sugar kinase [Verminephrobacter eiseniae]MCW8223871.1 sugar kinase [Verminephrobacter eiseniae]MCW8234977.1 sugar kinase [Verminephrobacter eiseniae]